MLTAAASLNQAVSRLLSVLLIGALLSACGCTAQSATPDTSAISVTPIVLPAATTVQLATVTLDGVIEQQ
jgi:hypothetical protein